MNDSESIPQPRPQERLILQQLKALNEKLLALDAEMAGDEQLRADTIEGETDILEQLRHQIRVALASEDWAAAIRARERQMASRRLRLTAKAEACRAFVSEAMAILGLKNLTSDDLTISLRVGQPSLQINMDKLPHAFKRITEEPNKPLIRIALSKGAVPGVVLGNATPVLTVKQD